MWVIATVKRLVTGTRAFLVRPSHRRRCNEATLGCDTRSGHRRGGCLARADDKPNPTGTWKWTVKFGEQTREMTLKLKLDGDKLTGAMLGRDGKETPIRTPLTRTASLVQGRPRTEWEQDDLDLHGEGERGHHQGKVQFGEQPKAGTGKPSGPRISLPSAQVPSGHR